MASALESCGNHALVLGAGTGLFAVHDLRVRGHETADRLGVLIVYGCYLVGAEVAVLLDLRRFFFALLKSHMVH